ncbi:MAG TPA: hypothetical protein VFZ22_16455 [Pyrinomonadaceae bacterium]|nr:hypothetical protein [Pyrinomonadaceae bacterium]
MWRIVFVIGLVLLFQPIATRAQSPAPKHGGKIESRYDGFNYETLAQLRKMKVSCDGVGDLFKDACVSIDVTLHFPGSQFNYVRNVTLQVIFENKDWVRIHPPEWRDLSISTESQTFRFGRMTLITRKQPGTWDTKIEVLEATIPYDAFKKIAQATQVEIKVGPGAVTLRDNNVAALRDLDSRVISATSNSSTGTSARPLSRPPDE